MQATLQRQFFLDILSKAGGTRGPAQGREAWGKALHPQAGAPRLSRKRAPRAATGHESAPWVPGPSAAPGGEEWVRAFVRCSTARVLQAALARAQAEGRRRDRSERREAARGDCHGSAAGTGKTAEGVLRGQIPHVRGLQEPSRAQRWAALGRTRDVLTARSVERAAGGRSPRDIAGALEKALGQCVVSKSALSDMTD
jgi:hypothetical protein